MQLTTINNKPVTAPFYPVKNSFSNPLTAERNQDLSVNVLVDKNYASLQAKKMNVSFTGAPPVKTTPLGEKVCNLFNVIRSNDVIVAAPSLDKAAESIEKHINSFNTVIKRLFYIEDKSMKGALGFKKNLEDKEVINLTDKPIIIVDSKNEAGVLKSGETGFLMDGDEIRAASKRIQIEEQMGISTPVKNYFTAFIDFDKDVDPHIRQINKKSIEKLKTTAGEKEPKKTMFSDVGGQDEAIKSLKKNIIYPIKHPEIKSGSNMNKSVLLYGPPGTGKSLLAEAASNEAGTWFKKINASELDSKYVGESEQNWRNLFEEAKENQPAIIFIDEFDAIAKKRGGQDVYGDKTLNTVLGLMSDTEKSGDDIYMIAATNNRAALDPAVTRSGRFGVAIEVGAPDLNGTEQILKIHTEKLPLDKDFDTKAISEKLYNEKATGADIAAVAEEARNNSMERNKIYEKIEQGTYSPDDMKQLKVTNEDFDKAIETFKKGKDNNAESRPRTQIGFNSPQYK